MCVDKESLLKKRQKWENDIQIYKDFLEGHMKTFDEKYGAEEYIELAQNRIEIIDLKLKDLI